MQIGHTARYDRTRYRLICAEESLYGRKLPWGEEYGEVERLYRNLPGKTISRLAIIRSLGDFHYGEMEMHRRASNGAGFLFTGIIFTGS